MVKSSRRLAAGSIMSVTWLVAFDASAEIVDVASSDELLAAIAAAGPGDEIVLAAGTYALSGASCTADGSEDEPIVVRAASPYAAIVEMDALEGFKVSGAHWHFEDLEIRGVCASDPDCEHAFHVVGGAEGFWLRNSRVLDFNAQLKVNAEPDGGGGYAIPHRGLIEGNDLRDTSPRDTDSPVTKLNIDTGDDWVVRANVIADFHKNGGNEISYGAFMKSGGSRGLFERNLVMCTYLVQTGGTRIGLSFGGGGTGAQFCAPAFDPDVPCDPEHSDGVMRNNVIVNCSDVGIYLNLARSTRVLSNTLIGTAGIDFRFASSTGEADGNLLGGAIRAREGGSFTAGTNVENVELDTFLAAYVGPLAGDLRVLGDVDPWIGAGPTRADVPDDYCLRDRPDGGTTLGALEHSLGDCTTFPPPVGESSSASVGTSAGSGGGDPSGSGGDASAGPGGPGAGPGSGGADASAGPGGTGASGTPSAASGPGASGAGGGAGDAASSEDDGCGCRVVSSASAPSAPAWLAAALGAAAFARRLRGPKGRRAARGDS